MGTAPTTSLIQNNSIATAPSLRDTSPQGEAFIWLPSRGAVATATEGVVSIICNEGDQRSPYDIFPQ